MAIKNYKPTLTYEDYLAFLDLQRGIIRVPYSISEDTANRFRMEIDYIKSLGLTDITVYISSPGGNAYDAFSMYDSLKSFDGNVTAVVNGLAASAAAMIVLQAANYRKATTNSRFLLHEVSRWVFIAKEKVSQLEDEVAEMKKIEQTVVNMLSEKCNKSDEEIRKLIQRREIWMSASEAKDWGLIDEVI